MGSSYEWLLHVSQKALKIKCWEMNLIFLGLIEVWGINRNKNGKQLQQCATQQMYAINSSWRISGRQWLKVN